MNSQTLWICIAAIAQSLWVANANTQQPPKEEHADAPIFTSPQFSAGDTAEMEMEITRFKQQTGKPPVKTKLSIQITLNVLEASPDKYVIAWTHGKVDLPDETKATIKDQAIIRHTEGSRLELIFDEVFNWQGIANLEEVASHTEKIIEITSQNPNETAEQKQALAATQNLFQDQKTIEALAVRQALTYFLGYGWQLTPGVRLELPTELPNAWGGEMLPAEIQVWMLPFESHDKHYQVRWIQEVSPDHVLSVATDFANKLGAPKLEGDENARDSLSFRQEAEFEINRTTGWTSYAQYTQTIKLDNFQQIDTYTFNLDD